MYKIVCFDFDDVVIDGNISDVVGSDFRGKLEKLRLLTSLILKRKDPDHLSDIVVQGARLARGMELVKVKKLAGKLRLAEGCIECLKALLKDKKRLVIVSVNDRRLIEYVLRKNKALEYFDDIYAGEFIVKDGKATGEVSGLVFEKGKGEAVREVSKKYQVNAEEIVSVGDGLSDVPMFKASGLAIVFNPKHYIMKQLSIDEELKAMNSRGDLVVVNGKLDIIPDLIKKKETEQR